MEEEYFSFEYSILERDILNEENVIKQLIRDNSLNLEISSDIKRYSDRYMQTNSNLNKGNMLNLEVISPELQIMLGGKMLSDTQPVIQEYESEINTEESTTEKESSLAGGDDYAENYFEDDDFVNDTIANQKDQEYY